MSGKNRIIPKSAIDEANIATFTSKILKQALAPQILTARLQDNKPLEVVADVIKFLCEKYSKDNYTGILAEIV